MTVVGPYLRLTYKHKHNTAPGKCCLSKVKPIICVKQAKYNSVEFLAQTKLERISGVISKKIREENLFSAEFHKIMQNMEKYCKIKEEIRRKTKQKEDKLQKNSENNCLKKRARKTFL